MVRRILVAAALVGCTKSHRVEPKDEAGDGRTPVVQADAPPAPDLAPVQQGALCVTKGSLVPKRAGSRSDHDPASEATIDQDVAVPTFRAVAPETAGDSASLEFVYRGETEKMRELGSGQLRRQLGLKLRAANGCNLVYAMWRLDPKPKL